MSLISKLTPIYFLLITSCFASQDNFFMLNEGEKTVSSENNKIKATHIPPQKDKLKSNQIAEKTIKQIQVLNELKDFHRKVRKLGESRLSLEKKLLQLPGVLSNQAAKEFREKLRLTPYTQSAAHLKSIGKESSFFVHNSYKKKFNEIMEAEKNHKDQFVFYHAANDRISFMVDIMTLLKANLEIIPQENLVVFRSFESFFNKHQTITDFLTWIYSLLGYSEKNLPIKEKKHPYASTRSSRGTVLDHRKDYIKIALPVNCFLFGSSKELTGAANEATYNYFIRGYSNKPPSIKILLAKLFSLLGLADDSITKYEELFKKYLEKKGRLYQIFIDPQIVDAVGYSSTFGGYPWVFYLSDKSEGYTGVREILYHIRQNPQNFKKLAVNSNVELNTFSKFKFNIDYYQPRLLLLPEFFSKADYVKIKMYWLSDFKEKETYFKELRKAVQEDVVNILQKQVSVDSSIYRKEMTRAQRLYKYSHEGEVGPLPKPETRKANVEKVPLGLSKQIVFFVEHGLIERLKKLNHTKNTEVQKQLFTKGDKKNARGALNTLLTINKDSFDLKVLEYIFRMTRRESNDSPDSLDESYIQEIITNTTMIREIYNNQNKNFKKLIIEKILSHGSKEVAAEFLNELKQKDLLTCLKISTNNPEIFRFILAKRTKEFGENLIKETFEILLYELNPLIKEIYKFALEFDKKHNKEVVKILRKKILEEFQEEYITREYVLSRFLIENNLVDINDGLHKNDILSKIKNRSPLYSLPHYRFIIEKGFSPSEKEVKFLIKGIKGAKKLRHTIENSNFLGEHGELYLEAIALEKLLIQKDYIKPKKK